MRSWKKTFVVHFLQGFEAVLSSCVPDQTAKIDSLHTYLKVYGSSSDLDLFGHVSRPNRRLALSFELSFHKAFHNAAFPHARITDYYSLAIVFLVHVYFKNY